MGVSAVLVWATEMLSVDSDAPARPRYARYELGDGVPDGSAHPLPTGLVQDSMRQAHILPPLPPERPQDIHTGANQLRDLALHNCFWPGPRARSGIYTNDHSAYAYDNQFPDNAATSLVTALQLPPGASLWLHGEFGHLRQWDLSMYARNGALQDTLQDVDIVADAGSHNPFVPAMSRQVRARSYTLHIVSGPVPQERASNTLYTGHGPAHPVYLWMRNVVPDNSTDYLGGVGLPTVTLEMADGRTLPPEAACALTQTTLRGKQIPAGMDPRTWMLLTRLPWVDTANVGATPTPAVAMRAYFHTAQVVTDTVSPLFSQTRPTASDAAWNNPATRYGYALLSRNFGHIYVLSAKLPSTPKTWAGEGNHSPDADMRYTAFCTVGSPVTGSTADCLYDEQLASAVDAQGDFAIVVSRQEDRPSNASPACGVAWLDSGNGDSLPNGSADFVTVINRQTQVNPGFSHSWFAVQRPGSEAQAMGAYLPYAVNLKTRARFESLGCPVDRRQLNAWIAAAKSG